MALQGDEECPGQPDADPPGDWAADPHDLTSYGSCTLWVSPRTWIRMFNAFTNGNGPFPKQSSEIGPQVLQDALARVPSERMEASGVMISQHEFRKPVGDRHRNRPLSSLEWAKVGLEAFPKQKEPRLCPSA